MYWTLDKFMGQNPICFKYETNQGELFGGLSNERCCSKPRIIPLAFAKWKY